MLRFLADTGASVDITGANAAAPANHAEPGHLTDDRLAELIASSPRISDERLAELSHLFRDTVPDDVPDPSALSDGIPDDYWPGHED